MHEVARLNPSWLKARHRSAPPAATMAGEVWRLVLLTLGSAVIGTAFLICVERNTVAACTEDSPWFRVSPVQWLYIVAVGTLTRMALRQLILAVWLCDKAYAIQLRQVERLAGFIWNRVLVALTFLELFISMDPACAGTPIYTCLLSLLILKWIGLCSHQFVLQTHVGDAKEV
jgi:hypothetical protein